MHDEPVMRKGLFDDEIGPDSPSKSAAEFRSAYLERESTVKTIGVTYFIGAGFILANALLFVSSEKLQNATIAQAQAKTLSADAMKSMAIVYLGTSVLISILFGFALRRLSNIARWIVVVCSVAAVVGGGLSLLNGVLTVFNPLELGTLAIGLMMSLFIATFLGSSPSSPLFTPEYRSAVAKTPEIRAQLGTRDKVLLVAYLLIGATGLVSQILKIR